MIPTRPLCKTKNKLQQNDKMDPPCSVNFAQLLFLKDNNLSSESEKIVQPKDLFSPCHPLQTDDQVEFEKKELEVEKEKQS